MSQSLVSLLVGMNLDLGQVDLFCEIFKNNKKICLEYYSELTDDFIKLIIAKGRRSKYLEFYLIILRVHDEFLVPIQKHIVNILLDPVHTMTVLYLREANSASE
jgi:hypothetical protein